MAEGGDFQLAEPMQASGRELGQEPDESEVGLLEDSTDKVGEEATQGELEGANQSPATRCYRMITSRSSWSYA